MGAFGAEIVKPELREAPDPTPEPKRKRRRVVKVGRSDDTPPSYRYRDADRRRAYMKDYMKKSRARKRGAPQP
jgi:hypothetical protein